MKNWQRRLTIAERMAGGYSKSEQSTSSTAYDNPTKCWIFTSWMLEAS